MMHRFQAVFYMPISIVSMGFAGALALLAAGCEMKPNPNFARDLESTKAASQGDTFSPLERVPQSSVLGWWKKEEYEARAKIESDRYRGVYESMLPTLDEEIRKAPGVPVPAVCRPAFTQVVEFQKRGAVKGSEAAVDVLFAELRQCREQAIAAADSADKRARPMLEVVRRFASSGMLLVGLTRVANGDNARGPRQWREGEKYLEEDKAGFKLSLESLRGF